MKFKVGDIVRYILDDEVSRVVEVDSMMRVEVISPGSGVDQILVYQVGERYWTDFTDNYVLDEPYKVQTLLDDYETKER
jgi:hypothetical protein